MTIREPAADLPDELKDPAAAARRLLQRERQGSLATLSQHRAGYPFGSVAPYALSPRGEPILVLSGLAQHTKNVLADPRASLLVQDSAGLAAGADVQAHGRVTLLGQVAPVPAVALPGLRARYLARHPEAARTAAGHDFRFYSLAIEEARFIGGFGKICWIAASALLLDPAQDPLAKASAGICAHMNGDHAEALALYCRALRGLSGEAARMLAVDAHGFDVEQGPAERREQVRFDFARPLATADEVRGAMVSLVKAARAAEAPQGSP